MLQCWCYWRWPVTAVRPVGNKAEAVGDQVEPEEADQLEEPEDHLVLRPRGFTFRLHKNARLRPQGPLTAPR